MQEPTHPICTPFAGDDRLMTHSNRAVQIWVGLELAEGLKGWQLVAVMLIELAKE